MIALLQRLGRAAWAMPAAIVAAVIVLAISESAYHRSTDSLVNLGERSAVRLQTLALLRSVVDAETGQRGYLLTGRREYLKPYEAAVQEVQQLLGGLNRRYHGDAEAAPLVARIERGANEKLSELSTTITLYDEGKHEAWRSLTLTDIGREKMEALRLDTERLAAIEASRITDERRLVFDTLRISRIGVALTTALSLLGLLLFVRQAALLDEERAKLSDAIRRERDQLEREVERRTAELTELAQSLQSAREDERSRLARELHDELGALLTAAKLDTARLRRSLAAQLPDAREMHERLDHLVSAVNEGIALKRRIIEDLRPSSLSNLGLAAAIEILAREFSQRAEIPVHTEVSGVRLKDDAEITAYRLVQEALTNIAKYAAAREVRVTLEAVGDRARVSVSDDGRGFDAGRTRGKTHGLMGMRYRVAAVGGTLVVQSRPGEGTRIEALLPLAPGA